MADLVFRYGAMSSGKSTALLQIVYNYERRGMKPALIKPAIDTKGALSVISRTGINRKVDFALKESELVSEIVDKEKIDIIVIDEAQFLNKEQVDDLFVLTKESDIPVLCYGLRTDFRLEGFPGAIRLLELSDRIEELETICKCGDKATINLRFNNGVPTFEGDQVVIDNSEDITYDCVCGSCYLKAKQRYRK